MYDFQHFETTRYFGDSIYTGKISIDEAEMDQTSLLESIVKFNNKSRPRSKEDKDKKRITFDSVNDLYESRKLTLNAFRIGIFPVKKTQGKGHPRMLASRPLSLSRQLKVLSPK